MSHKTARFIIKRQYEIKQDEKKFAALEEKTANEMEVAKKANEKRKAQTKSPRNSLIDSFLKSRQF